MTNRLQIRRGTGDATAVSGTRAGEPLFNSATGQFYVSDGTEVHDVVLEGLRRVRNIYTGTIDYPMDSYVTFNGNTYRASAAIAANAGDPENNDNWVRVGYTENEIRDFANQQNLEDTTAVHLDITHGSYAPSTGTGFNPLDEVDTQDTTAINQSAFLVYNPVSDIVEFTIATSATQAQLETQFPNGTLVSLSAVPADRVPDPDDPDGPRPYAVSNGNLVSVFEVTLGSTTPSHVTIRAHPYPASRRLIRAAATAIAEGPRQGQLFISRDTYVGAAVPDNFLSIFTPLVSGQLVAYNADASNDAGVPVINTIEAVRDLPESPTVGTPILLTAPRGYDLNVRPVYPLATHRVGSLFNTQVAYQVGTTDGGGTLPDFQFNDVTSPFENISNGDDRSEAFSQAFNQAIAETWIPFVPVTSNPFANTSVPLSAASFASEAVLRQDFVPGDIVTFWHDNGRSTQLEVAGISRVFSGFNGNADAEIGGLIPVAGIDPTLAVPYVRFRGFLDIEDIGIAEGRVTSPIRLGAADGGIVIRHEPGNRSTLDIIFRDTVTRDSVHRAITTNVPQDTTTTAGTTIGFATGETIGSLLFSDTLGRPMFALGMAENLSTAARHMRVETNGANNLRIRAPDVAGDDPVIRFMNFDTNGVPHEVHNTGSSELSATLEQVMLEGGTGYVAGRPAGTDRNNFIHNIGMVQASYRSVSTQDPRESFSTADLPGTFQYFFPRAGRTQIFNNANVNTRSTNTLRYVRAAATDPGRRGEAIATGDEDNLLVLRPNEGRGNIPQNTAELGLRVWNGFSWR